MLLLANGIVRGTVDRQTARNEQSEFLVDIGDEYDPHEGPGPSMAASAAARAVHTALFDRHANDLGGPESDDQIDPDVWPTEFFASEAATLARSGQEDVERRRAFWNWFLTEAVPAAYFADSVTADQG
jgi:hypothetical protein